LLLNRFLIALFQILNNAIRANMSKEGKGEREKEEKRKKSEIFYDHLREIQFPIILHDLHRHGEALKSCVPSAAQLIRIKNADDYHILSLIVIVMVYS